MKQPDRSQRATVCLYSPYVPKHLGGGEKHFFDVAVTLAERYTVVIAVPYGQLTPDTAQKYEAFLGYSLAQVQWCEGPLGTEAGWWRKLWWSRQFHALYYVSDGSFFFSLAAKNIAHLQFPFAFAITGLFNRLKLGWWRKNANSKFTQKVLEKNWQTRIPWVHYPMVELPSDFTPLPKEKIILNVGRFFRQLHSKRQDVLVEVFRQWRARDPKTAEGWQLVLVGSVEDESYAEEVAVQAADLPVLLIHQLDRKQLWQWYNRATLYWHAAGFGIDEASEPLKVEHFGISTVEAMLAGCIPVVVGKGGQAEILSGELAELTWQTQAEAVEITQKLLTKPSARAAWQAKLAQRASDFGRERFSKTVWEMFR